MIDDFGRFMNIIQKQDAPQICVLLIITLIVLGSIAVTATWARDVVSCGFSYMIDYPYLNVVRSDLNILAAKVKQLEDRVASQALKAEKTQ